MHSRKLSETIYYSKRLRTGDIFFQVPHRSYAEDVQGSEALIYVVIGAFTFRHGQNDIEDGVHAKVNGGYDGRYADAGPPSANGTNKFVQQPQSQPEQQHQQQEAAAPPAYAVVDKSKKKKKKAVTEDPYAEVEDPRKVRKRSQA